MKKTTRKKATRKVESPDASEELRTELEAIKRRQEIILAGLNRCLDFQFGETVKL